MCLFVCLSLFPHDISKTDATRIIKLDTEMCHRESWKYTYLGSRDQKVKGHGHEAPENAVDVVHASLLLRLLAPSSWFIVRLRCCVCHFGVAEDRHNRLR